MTTSSVAIPSFAARSIIFAATASRFSGRSRDSVVVHAQADDRRSVLFDQRQYIFQ